jgi:hypothetical protein
MHQVFTTAAGQDSSTQVLLAAGQQRKLSNKLLSKCHQNIYKLCGD